MQTSRFTVRQWLTVQTFHQDGSELRVSVTDAEGDRHRITFVFDDPITALAQIDLLESWRDGRTPLTYVKSARHGTLVDDEVAFRRAFGGEDLVGGGEF